MERTRNLVVGNTSQLSQYFPNDYIKISSRDIDNGIFEQEWDSVYLTFAKQNVFDSEDSDFFSVNTYYTLDIIERLLLVSNRIVVYTTCEIYQNHYGPISISTEPSFQIDSSNYSNYIQSKYLLNQMITINRVKDVSWNKVVIIHPFNFESIHKNKYFLFGKIVDSIVNETVIDIGDIDFYKDILHTSRMVEQSIKSDGDCVIGSGRLINVRDTVIGIYKHFDMDYNIFVNETPREGNRLKFYYTKNKLNHNFIDDMVTDIKKIKYEKNTNNGD